MNSFYLRYWIVCLLVVLSSSAPILSSAQENESGNSLDSNYVADHSDFLSIKLFGVAKSNVIMHYDSWTMENIEYKPNENFNIGLGFVHKWLGLDLAFNFPFINDDDEIFGKTKRFDIQFNIYLRRYLVDLHYQQYKGYYGSNPWLYSDNYSQGSLDFPIRPDIKTFNTAINGLYIFNEDKFSYRAAFIYNERQLRSAGSFMAGGYFSYFTMNADSAIVPPSSIIEFNPNADFRGVKYINTGISGGYGHTFVIGKKFFISLSLVVGLGPAFINIPQQGNIPSSTKVEMATRGVIRTAIGFNSERTYFGISGVTTNSAEVDIEQSRLSRGVNNFKIFFGKRFDAPGFLRKI